MIKAMNTHIVAAKEERGIGTGDLPLFFLQTEAGGDDNPTSTKLAGHQLSDLQNMIVIVSRSISEGRIENRQFMQDVIK